MKNDDSRSTGSNPERPPMKLQIVLFSRPIAERQHLQKDVNEWLKAFKGANTPSVDFSTDSGYIIVMIRYI